MKSCRFGIVCVILIGIVCGCRKNTSLLEAGSSTEFAIHIALETARPDLPLDNIPLEEDPFISLKDIITYVWMDHRIIVSDTVYERLASRRNLLGRLFVISVDGERIYWGLFLCDAFSSIWQNPVIRLTPDESGPDLVLPRPIIIDRAYPWFMGDENEPDPRADPRIYEALLKTGKLVD